MVRVLHVFGRLDRGGAESRTMDIYRALDRNQVQFDFVAHTTQEGDFSQEIRMLGGNVFSVPKFRLYNAYGYQKAWRKLFLANPDYRIIHIHTTNSAAIILTEAQRAGLPVRIAHARNASDSSFIKRVVAWTTRRVLNQKSTHRFAVSRLAAGYVFGKRAVRLEQVRIIPNAIDVGRYRYRPVARENMIQTLRLENRLIIGHIGRFELQKNHRYLLSIFACIREHRSNAVLVLIGKGSLQPQIRALAEKSGYADDILFLGLRSDVPDLLQAMDILLLPSFHEGLPGVVLEAQAAGLPCLVSDRVTRECGIVPGLCEFLPIGGSPAVWADTLDRKMHMPREATEEIMRAAGFDVSTQAKWYEQFYAGY